MASKTKVIDESLKVKATRNFKTDGEARHAPRLGAVGVVRRNFRSCTLRSRHALAQ